ncbi:MAG: hypothetical protein ACM3S2_20170 [Ignavibacteriales bacterium]
MLVAQIITTISPLVWLFPVLKQYKGQYGYYFFILAASDPVGTIFLKMHILLPHAFHLIFSVALIFAAQAAVSKREIKWELLLPSLVISLIVGASLPKAPDRLITAAIQIIIFIIILRQTVIFSGKYRYVSFFHILLLTYQASLIYKMINLVLLFQKGSVYFFFTTAFEIILGILFCVFTEKDKRFALNLSKYLSYR